MKNKLLILLLLFTANISFGQQISVQNNELKYRITGGTIKTAADKYIFQAKVDTLTNRLNNYLVDSASLALKLSKAANLSDLTSASSARTNLGLGTLATQSGTFTDKLTLQISNTFAAIGGSTSVRLILVLVDETNGNKATIYFHTGQDLQWIPSIII